MGDGSAQMKMLVCKLGRQRHGMGVLAKVIVGYWVMLSLLGDLFLLVGVVSA